MLLNKRKKEQGWVPRKMVKFNPGLRKILNNVLLSKNLQLELTKNCWAFTLRYNNDNTKCYSKQYIERKNTKTEQNFNPPGLALIRLSETEPGVDNSPGLALIGLRTTGPRTKHQTWITEDKSPPILSLSLFLSETLILVFSQERTYQLPVWCRIWLYHMETWRDSIAILPTKITRRPHP